MDIRDKHDPGLAYLKMIGFNRVKGPHGLINSWAKLYGLQKANRLFDQFGKLQPGSKEFYEFKNSDFDISRTFSEAFDGEILRKACNFVNANRECFGETILEIGCDTGYMTGFLGLLFPDSKIVAIERGTAAIQFAKERIERLGLTNVEIINCSLDEVKEQFDTVFSMRTLQENIDMEIAPFEGDAIRYVCKGYKRVVEKYLKSIKERIKPEGYLCAFERVGHDPLLIALLEELSDIDLGVDLESYKEFLCNEGNYDSVFQAFICKNGSSTDIKAFFDSWYKSFQNWSEKNHELTGWSALVYLDENAGKLIRGVYYYNIDKNGGRNNVGRIAVFEDRDGDPLAYYLLAQSGNIKMVSANASIMDQIMENMDMQIETCKRNGYKIEIIDPNDANLEGNITDE